MGFAVRLHVLVVEGGGWPRAAHAVFTDVIGDACFAPRLARTVSQA